MKMKIFTTGSHLQIIDKIIQVIILKLNISEYKNVSIYFTIHKI